MKFGVRYLGTSGPGGPTTSTPWCSSAATLAGTSGEAIGRRRDLDRLRRLAGLRGPEELLEAPRREEDEHADLLGF